MGSCGLSHSTDRDAGPRASQLDSLADHDLHRPRLGAAIDRFTFNATINETYRLAYSAQTAGNPARARTACSTVRRSATSPCCCSFVCQQRYYLSLVIATPTVSVSTVKENQETSRVKNSWERI